MKIGMIYIIILFAFCVLSVLHPVIPYDGADSYIVGIFLIAYMDSEK